MKTSCIGNLVLGLSLVMASAAYGATSSKPKANAAPAADGSPAPAAEATSDQPKQSLKTKATAAGHQAKQPLKAKTTAGATAAKPHMALKQSRPVPHFAAKSAATKASPKWTPKATSVTKHSATKHHRAKHVAWVKPRAKTPAVWKAPKGHHVSAHKTAHAKGKKAAPRRAAAAKPAAKPGRTAVAKTAHKSKKGLHAKPLGKITHKVARKPSSKVTHNAKFADSTNLQQESSNYSWLALFIAFVAACVGGLLYMKKKKTQQGGIDSSADGTAVSSSEMPLTSSMSHLELSQTSGMGTFAGRQPATGAKGFGGDGKTNVTGRPKSA